MESGKPTYRPTVVTIPGCIGQAFGLMLVELRQCPTCGRYMVRGKYGGGNSPFPRDIAISFGEQARQAGWEIESEATDAQHHTICRTCAQGGKATFVCHHCKREQPTGEIEESFGDPPDHLCKSCYATTPAREWDEVVAHLEEAHRFDWE